MCVRRRKAQRSLHPAAISPRAAAHAASPSVTGACSRCTLHTQEHTGKCGHMRAHVAACQVLPRVTGQRTSTTCVNDYCLRLGAKLLDAPQLSCHAARSTGGPGRPGRALLVPGQRARLAEALQRVPQVACAAPRGSAARGAQRADLPRHAAAAGRPDRRPASSHVGSADIAYGDIELGVVTIYSHLPQVRVGVYSAHRLVFSARRTNR